jgi:hypothetical protein
MHTNWIIVGVVIIFAILLLIYLIRRNLKDEKEVIEHFNENSSTFPDDESEANDV